MERGIGPMIGSSAGKEPMDPILGKKILRQIAVVSSRYGLGDEGIEWVEMALDAGFYDDNIASALLFCLANNNRASDAVERYREVEQRLGGADRAPSSYVAAIYAFVKNKDDGIAYKMMESFETKYVPHLKEEVRSYYVDFLKHLREDLMS